MAWTSWFVLALVRSCLSCVPREFNDLWGCPSESLGPELLQDPNFGNEASWEKYLKDEGLASFSFGNGLVLEPFPDQSDVPWHVQLSQPVSLDQGGGDPAHYALCVQATSSKAGLLKFAVDAGATLNFAVAGGGGAAELKLRAGAAGAQCFAFRLGPSGNRYIGRVALDLGGLMDRSEVCQVSLKRCAVAPRYSALVPVRRCYLPGLEEAGGCRRLDVFTGGFFNLNQYGQETTGKRVCLEETRRVGGDSFVYSVGRCEVWRCERRSTLVESTTSEGEAKVLFSQFCDYDEQYSGAKGGLRRSPVYIQLWEWNYDDIAQECTRYLGPNGIDAVQISPVTEHILGTQWYTKYQPIGFGLNSRSGTRKQLQSMIATCRRFGVQIMVDVILNHVARACPRGFEAGSQAVMPCSGWAGSNYGNRRIDSQDGWKGPELFHNILGNLMGNCPVVEPNFTCPQSEPPGDCTKCDFKGLPDWNTGLLATQNTLAKHLEELQDLGVTMLRLDAASYISSEDLAAVLNRMPWDVVHQEWWGGTPAIERSELVGHYRDQKYGLKIANALGVGDVKYMAKLLNITQGLEGIPPERAVYPLTFHDARTWEPDRFVPTYMNGLEFHQQQKFLLAWPGGVAVRLWAGYTFTHMDEGPPGNCGNGRCQPTSVYVKNEPRCMPTPKHAPLSQEEKLYQGYVCEHRWEGVAGLVNFRKACRPVPVTGSWSSLDDSASLGHFAWRNEWKDHKCFAALVRGNNERWPNYWGDLGEWSLAGMNISLPGGRYCDLGSLSTQLCWDQRSCPREVVVSADGVVVSGSVRQGDLLAIHTSARLEPGNQPRFCMEFETSRSSLMQLTLSLLSLLLLWL